MKLYLILLLNLFSIISASLAYSAESEDLNEGRVVVQPHCLDLLSQDPRLAAFNVDEIYYESLPDLELFASRFFVQVVEGLKKSTGCQMESNAKPQFVCSRPDRVAPFCGARLGDYSLAIVKDYVDSARLIAGKAHANSKVQLPGVSKRHDWTTLYIPDPGACYDGLLDLGGDSQAYLLDTSSFLPSADKRFLMAQTLRRLVKEKSKEDRFCSYDITKVPTKEVSCQALSGSDFDLCLLTSTSGGYLSYLWLPMNPKVTVVFNRWD